MTRYNNISVQSNDANYNNLNAKYETHLFSQTQNLKLRRGYGGGRRGRLYIYRYTVTTRMIPALRWAAMRAILMFHNCEEQSRKTVSMQTTTFNEKGEPKQIRTEVPLLTSLMPYR